MNNDIKRTLDRIRQEKIVNFSRNVHQLSKQNGLIEKEIKEEAPLKMKPETLFQHSNLLKGNNKFFKK